jgi:hypothetical protein
MFFFIVQCSTQMLKFCELDQISILDEVVVGAWTVWLAQGIMVEVWTKVF